jgi:membrane-associated phospholipid phosphatase
MRALHLTLDRLIRWAAPDGILRRTRVFLVLVLAYGVFAATYLPINLFSRGRPARTLYLPGEASIPFVPAFEFLYVLGYLLPVLAVFALPGPRELRRLLVAFGTTLLVAYGTYLLFPVWFERPALQPDSLATWLLWLEYHDPSYNHFPSLHVGISWLLYLACRRGVRFPRLFLVTVLGIALSTLLVKQHYMVDVLYGIGLASLTWAATALLDRKLAA